MMATLIISGRSVIVDQEDIPKIQTRKFKRAGNSY